MTDIEQAVKELEGHSVCFCKSGKIISCDGRGISPLMKLIEENAELKGFSAADLIVGKAAAMLFVRLGIISVYGKVMSVKGRDYLEAHGIQCSFGVLTDSIINRRGDGICPMEKTVAGIDDNDAGYEALKVKIMEMKKHG
ncbi:MAG: DUF1893 domain-containing protein [Huintestinicola sp.]